MRESLYYANKLDRHTVIDLLGVGRKYIPLTKQVKDEKGYRESSFDVLRGIEIKVSRADFKRGFIQTGCNYNYLMFPKGLIERDEVPKGVGVIAVDVDNFSWSKHGTRYYLKGIETLRSPRFKAVPEIYFNYAVRQMPEACSNQMVRWARDGLRQRLRPTPRGD